MFVLPCPSGWSACRRDTYDPRVQLWSVWRHCAGRQPALPACNARLRPAEPPAAPIPHVSGWRWGGCVSLACACYTVLCCCVVLPGARCRKARWPRATCWCSARTATSARRGPLSRILPAVRDPTRTDTPARSAPLAPSPTPRRRPAASSVRRAASPEPLGKPSAWHGQCLCRRRRCSPGNVP